MGAEDAELDGLLAEFFEEAAEVESWCSTVTKVEEVPTLVNSTSEVLPPEVVASLAADSRPAAKKPDVKPLPFVPAGSKRQLPTAEVSVISAGAKQEQVVDDEDDPGPMQVIGTFFKNRSPFTILGLGVIFVIAATIAARLYLAAVHTPGAVAMRSPVDAVPLPAADAHKAHDLGTGSQVRKKRLKGT
mmetsp:Transcript_5756/g.13688  ORF Transcript_5756/g.13688 Transcript_5756/m.13688 type:complete len:188 (+) Transcript_5756:76-639(+)